MNKLDNLFKERLINYSEKPSDTAWQQISTQINKKKKNGFFLRFSVAATITAVVCLSIYFLILNPKTDPILTDNVQHYDIKNNETENEIGNSKENKEDTNLTLTTPKISSTEIQNVNEQKVNERKSVDVVPVPKNEIDKVEKMEIQPVQNLAHVPEMQVPEQVVEVEENTEVKQEISIEENSELVASAKEELPSVVITYKRSQWTNTTNVEEKMAEVDGDNKESTFEKVILLAQDIKSGSFGLSNLRQAKDNLLDIDLRKIDSRFRTN